MRRLVRDAVLVLPGVGLHYATSAGYLQFLDSFLPAIWLGIAAYIAWDLLNWEAVRRHLRLATYDKPAGWLLWTLWVVGTTASATLAGIVAEGHMRTLFLVFPWDWAITGAELGVAMGTVQWLLLRRVTRIGKWPWITVGGLALGFGVGEFATGFAFEGGYSGVPEWMQNAIWGAVAGVAVGWWQRRQLCHLPRARWWVWACTLAWAIALPSGYAIGYFVGQENPVLIGSDTRTGVALFFPSVWPSPSQVLLGWMAGTGAAGVIVGVITGTVLLWLLRPVSPAPAPP